MLLIFVRFGVPTSEVILVTTIGVSSGIIVVLEQIDRATDSFVLQPFFGANHQFFKLAFSRFVVHRAVIN